MSRPLLLRLGLKLFLHPLRKYSRSFFLNVLETLAILDYTVNSLSTLIVHSAG